MPILEPLHVKLACMVWVVISPFRGPLGPRNGDITAILHRSRWVAYVNTIILAKFRSFSMIGYPFNCIFSLLSDLLPSIFLESRPRKQGELSLGDVIK